LLIALHADKNRPHIRIPKEDPVTKKALGLFLSISV